MSRNELLDLFQHRKRCLAKLLDAKAAFAVNQRNDLHDVLYPSRIWTEENFDNVRVISLRLKPSIFRL